ncbi:MAG: transposase [Patescibacteria group bacterium]
MELFHLLNRGVDKRKIVMDDSDRARFIHDLFAFNDSNIVLHVSQSARKLEILPSPRDLLVHIHAFCLMDNHYHLLVSEAQENGISLFMQKLNMGYTKYFNERYDRTGTLWQGKYKRIQIERDAHYMYIPFYIHLNPLDYVNPEWRLGNVKNVKECLRALRSYRWSSHLDYLGVKNFPSVIHRDLIADMLGTPKHYEQEIAELITDETLARESDLLE